MILSFFFFVLLFFTGTANLYSQNKQIDSLKLVLSRSKEDTIKVKSLIELSWEYKQLAQFDTAIQYANESLALAKKINFKHGEGDAYRRLALYYSNKNDLDKAREYLYAAIKAWEEAGDYNYSENYWEERSLAILYLEIHKTYVIEDNYPEAIKNALIALSLYEKAGNKYGMGMIYSFLSSTYYNYVDYATSRKYGLLSLQLFKELNNKFGIAAALVTLGEVETEMGEDSLALIHVLSAIEVAKELKDENAVSVTTRILAKIHLNQGQRFLAEKNIPAAQEKLRLAEKYSFSSLAYFEEKQSYVNQAFLYYFLGEIYRGLQDYPKSKYYQEKANKLSVSTKNKYTAKLSYLGLYRLDSIHGNYKSALNNYRQFILYRDSIANNEITGKLELSNMQYEFDKKEDSLKQKQVLTQVRLEAQQKQKYFYWAGIGLLGLLSFFVLKNLRNQKKLNRLDDEAHAREKAELELHSLRAQLNPHFMFNSLNAIQELILLEENEKSQSYLARFAKLLRMLLDNAEQPFIPLQRELDFLKLYLSLENLRVPDLKHSINVDSSIDTEKTVIPNMILQPYIENAIWHGLSHKKGDKMLFININRHNGTVNYEIKDNGVGRKKSAELKSLFRKEHKSKGMELLSKRFKLLAKEYGSDIETTISDLVTNDEVTGTIVSIDVPMKFSKELVK